jgi:class 3 adenylate cyclase
VIPRALARRLSSFGLVPALILASLCRAASRASRAVRAGWSPTLTLTWRPLIAAWRRRGRELGFGAGIAQGYATLGQIGFAERSGYTAIGTVCNVAARLYAEAKDGQILLSQRVAMAVEQGISLEEVGALALKGLTQPIVAFNVPVASSANVVTIRPERARGRIPSDRAR